MPISSELAASTSVAITTERARTVRAIVVVPSCSLVSNLTAYPPPISFSSSVDDDDATTNNDVALDPYRTSIPRLNALSLI